MAYKPTRRRGPNKPKIAGPDGDTIAAPVASVAAQPVPEPAPEPEPATDAAPTRRRKRADVGGVHLRLGAPARPGFQRRWVNDEPGRIALLHELAYEHVSEQGIKSDGPDSRVRRLVGTQAGGAPQNAYLMETPDAEFQAGVREKEEARKPFDEAIQRGEDPLNSGLTAQVQSHDSYIR